MQNSVTCQAVRLQKILEHSLYKRHQSCHRSLGQDDHRRSRTLTPLVPPAQAPTNDHNDKQQATSNTQRTQTNKPTNQQTNKQTHTQTTTPISLERSRERALLCLAGDYRYDVMAFTIGLKPTSALFGMANVKAPRPPASPNPTEKPGQATRTETGAILKGA